MSYDNFELAIYCTVHYLESINDISQLAQDFKQFEKHLKCSKVYLETFRADLQIGREKMVKIKEFFKNKGIKVSGGITTVAQKGLSGFAAFCYTNSKNREKLRDIVRFTAELFDEIILDDFFFTNCKCQSCIQAKGDKTWSEFRTQLLKEVSCELVDAAKEVNPDVRLIIKYPNWYDHYQNTGYNLKDQPQIFDMIYTGTETRDPRYTQQHIQGYLSYFLMRYMENASKGRNGGGWFDNLDCLHNLGYYMEQIYLTLFSKAREVTLFSMGSLKDSVYVPMAGYGLEKIDEFLGELGDPVGVACYKPYHSSGEDNLYDYLGMLGIPFEPVAEFPQDSDVVFLSASAAHDSNIVDKIKSMLLRGKTVFMTSGLLAELQDRGFEDVALIKRTDRKAVVDLFACDTKSCAFRVYSRATKKVLLSQLEYSTNDSWPVIVAIDENNNFPVLLETQYGRGLLYVLNIPDNYSDLYHYPREVLLTVRQLLMENIFVKLDCESRVGLFVYNNDAFVVESFLPYNTDVNIIINGPHVGLLNIISGKKVKGNTVGDKTIFTVNIEPTAYCVYKCIK
ncbi:hypothetical protein [Caldanaerobius polysaccharolyticus]|uniref:hypothetical protein n=1 Tax=Caldanaerobius polysaccharolyticus TaxID=44256 RepID=UPI00047B51C2|nr:hypothetical protein [Caldanaerobius polysaccharolyticus]